MCFSIPEIYKKHLEKCDEGFSKRFTLDVLYVDWLAATSTWCNNYKPTVKDPWVQIITELCNKCSGLSSSGWCGPPVCSGASQGVYQVCEHQFGQQMVTERECGAIYSKQIFYVWQVMERVWRVNRSTQTNSGKTRRKWDKVTSAWFWTSPGAVSVFTLKCVFCFTRLKTSNSCITKS